MLYFVQYLITLNNDETIVTKPGEIKQIQII